MAQGRPRAPFWVDFGVRFGSILDPFWTNFGPDWRYFSAKLEVFGGISPCVALTRVFRAQRASERSELSARADKGDSKQLRAPGNSDRKQRAAAYGCTQNWSKRRRLNSNSSIESKRCPSTKIALPVHLLRQVFLCAFRSRISTKSGP